MLLLAALVLGGCTRGGAAATDAVAGTTTSTSPTSISTTTTSTTTTTSSTTPTTPTTSSTSSTSTSTATAPTTTVTPTSTTTSTSSTTTTSTTTSTTTPTTTTTVPLWSAPLDLSQRVFAFGSSVEGRALVAERYGDPGGRRVLIIGVIHGNEAAGVAIIDELRVTPPPPGVELWLVESMNPDGQAAGDRHNAHQVDLNRNFPYNWGPIGEPGVGQYAGPGAASEPETLAVVNLITQLRPDITIWYHQDLFTISPSTGRDGRIRARYSELTGVPLGEITGGIYTGVAATWARRELEPDGGVAFIVELGATLTDEEAARHAAAVATIGAEG